MLRHAQQPKIVVCLEMAAFKTKPKTSETAFWTAPGKGLSGKGESYVPGVTDVGNLRPRVKGGRTKEVRASVPVDQPIVEDLDPHNSAVTTDVSQSLLETDASTITTTTIHGKTVSLRDLCVEDKKRVANLIKELAKVGEEKENAEKNLEEERQHYEEQILKLVEQQEQILREREDVQKRLLEYQTYILKLQQEQQLQQLQQHQKNLQHKRKHQLEQQPPPSVDKFLKPNDNRNNSSAGNNLQPKTVGYHPVNQDLVTPPTAAYDFLNFKEDGEDDMEKTIADQPSAHVYLNEMDETGTENFSTQVQAPLSPPPISDGTSSRPQRPFTAMIDKELANQRQFLAVSVELKKSVAPLSQSEVRKQGLESESGEDENGKKEQMHSPRMNNKRHETESGQTRTKDGEGKIARNLFVTRAINMQAGSKQAYADTHEPYQAFGTGNTQYLSPEKNELISRYMQSQSELLKSKFTTDDDFPNIDRKKASIQETNGGILKKKKDQKHQLKRKKRKPPPPTYGPLHAPVMSSTQKSSEFGDYISVDSTLCSDRYPQDMRQRHNKIVDEDDGDDESDDEENADDNSEEESSGDDNTDSDLNNNNDDNNKDRLNINTNSDKPIDRKLGDASAQAKKGGKKKEKGPKVEFSDKPAKRAVDKLMPATSTQVGVDEDFLCRYQKMSASERKAELLKQRSMLLDEQNKLKRILADQEFELKQKQQEALAKMQKMEQLKDDEKQQMKKMKLSLKKMEKDLAKKEEELIKGRELLAKRREEQLAAENAVCLSDKSSKRPPAKDSSSPGTKDKPGTLGNNNRNFSTPLGSQEKIRAVEGKTRVKGKEVVSPVGGGNHGKNVSSGADRQPGARSSPLDEKQIVGQDGDSCTLYPEEDVSKVKKKLDYSLHSDTESEAASKPQSTNQNRPITTPTNEKATPEKVGGARPLPSSADREEFLEKVDVGTSISYAHLPREKMVTVKRRGTSQGKQTKIRQKSSGAVKSTKFAKYQHSPGEKTLSVLEIINSMEDQETVLKRRQTSHRTDRQKGSPGYGANLNNLHKTSYSVKPAATGQNLKITSPSSRHGRHVEISSSASKFGRHVETPSPSSGSKLHKYNMTTPPSSRGGEQYKKTPPSSKLLKKHAVSSPSSKRSVLDELNTGQFYSPLQQEAYSSLPEADPVLDLFELKRTRRRVRDYGKRDGISDLLGMEGSSGGNLLLDLSDDEGEDTNTDKILGTLDYDILDNNYDDDNDDYEKENDIEHDFDEDEEDIYKDNVSVGSILKTMGDMKLFREDRDVAELEESKILEEVFFVV